MVVHVKSVVPLHDFIKFSESKTVAEYVFTYFVFFFVIFDLT